MKITQRQSNELELEVDVPCCIECDETFTDPIMELDFAESSMTSWLCRDCFGKLKELLNKYKLNQDGNWEI